MQDVVGESIKAQQELLGERHERLKIIWVTSNKPLGEIIRTSPVKGEALADDQVVVIAVSAGPLEPSKGVSEERSGSRSINALYLVLQALALVLLGILYRWYRRIGNTHSSNT